MPKLHTVAQKFIHVVLINSILSWVGGKEQSVFCCVVSFILLECNFRNINYYYNWLPLFITVSPWLQSNDALYRGILSLSKTGSVAHPISGVNVISAIHSDNLCISVHLSRYSQSKIQNGILFASFRPYSGHLVRRSLIYKRPSKLISCLEALS